jgi:nucleoside-diphosphate-sugar epimerase
VRIAITGATGFIGRHVLVQLHAQRAHDLVLVSRQERVDSLNRSDLQWVKMEVGDPPADAFERMGRPDVLIHLAWDGLPNYASRHHFERELPAQYYFLKSLIQSGLKKLLITGTCFEYGMQSGALAEDTLTMPANPYGFAKDVLRKQLEFLQRDQYFQLIWARLFYLYGDGQSANSLLSQLRKAAASRTGVFNMSAGDQLRDYMPVENAAKCIASLAVSDNAPAIINICSGKPVSVRGMVEQWLRKFEWELKLNLGYYPYSPNEPMAFWGDCRVLNQYLGSIRQAGQFTTKERH